LTGEARDVETARLLLEAARYLGETLEPRRVYERFHELLADAIPHDGLVVSSYTPDDNLIRCDYAWVDGEVLDVSIFPPLQAQAEGGMQSQVIRTGEPLLENDVKGRVQAPGGTYYEIDGRGNVNKLSDEGEEPAAEASMMLPVKHEGKVVGVVHLTSDHVSYDQGQLGLAEGMVAQLGASARNARLHEETLRLEAAAAAARAVAEERERAAQLLEAVGDGIFAVDLGGIVRFWNPAAETITGLRVAAVRDRPLIELGPEWATLATVVPSAPHGERPRSVTLPVDVGGRELWLSFVAVESDDIVVYAFRDLTAERQFEQGKDDFIATVSHELRTPMTAVLGAANTLLRSDVEISEGMKRQLLEMIASQATRLAEVTESVLLAGRLDRGEVRIETEHVDVDALAGEIVDILEPNLPDAITVVRRLEGGAEALGDPNRLQQVLINLLDNAAKYSPDGGIVTVTTSHVGDRVRIEVADQGAGIAPADQRRVFERFFRGDPTHRIVPGGTGLGLYISRELVERMGGTIRVASEPGAGSTFTVELPVAPG
jgi:PAS domain S-box-containing protein